MEEHPAVRAGVPALASRLTETAYAPPPDLSYDAWENDGYAIGRMAKASALWLGDWINFGDRAYGEKYTQALNVTGLDEQTLLDYAWVARKVEISLRSEILSYNHHRLVAPLAPAEQDHWLKRAEVEDWSVRDLRRELRHREETNPPVLPDGTFSTLVADPPWRVQTGPGTFGGSSEARVLVYPTMDVDAIEAMDVKSLAAPDAHLYLWTINAYVEDAYRIARAWGFTPSTLLTWCKPRHGLGLGGTYVLTSEFVLFATRGSLGSLQRIDSSWFEWPRRGHSVKPHEFYSQVESVSPGPYLELFARQQRPGWEVWGNEVTEVAHAA